MTPRPFPFPTGSPEEEITFLIQFVNGDWEVFTSDGMTEAFYCVHTSEGHPITREVVAALRDEARTYLRTIARRRRPHIAGVIYEKADRYGRRRRITPEGDFSARVRGAARHLIELRRRIRECRICEDFFLPHGPEPYCNRCRNGGVATALRIEQAQQRTRRCRERQRLNEQNEHRRLLEQIERRPTARRRLAELDERVLALDRNYHRLPRPALAIWEVTVQIGVKASDVQVQVGGAWVSGAVLVPETPERAPLSMTFSGEYAEILKSYRAERLKGRKFIA